MRKGRLHQKGYLDTKITWVKYNLLLGYNYKIGGV